MKKKLLGCCAILILLVWVGNSSYVAGPPEGKPWLLAHRGLGQTFSMEGLTGETNTAARIFPPDHPFLENTIPSMEAAFKAGADVIELDIHPTTDGTFAVFHDWTIDFRTEGKGVTREQSMSYLKTLDVGFGYTADQGKTFPFRGRGVGLMPSLDEVLKHFPEGRFLIHVKGNEQGEGDLLAAFLATFPEKRLDQLWFYGGDKPIARLKEKLPRLRVLSKAIVKQALIEYLGVGWTGYLPPSMKNSLVIIPMKYTALLWGWPHRFARRMTAAGTEFAVVEGDGTWSEGFDTVESLNRLPASFTGGIWTNRIDRIAPAVRNRQ